MFVQYTSGAMTCREQKVKPEIQWIFNELISLVNNILTGICLNPIFLLHILQLKLK